MRVLLTGGTGFIGRHVLRDLMLNNDVEVYVVGRVKPDGPAKFIERDLLKSVDFPALMREIRPTHLLHLAWYAEHGRYWSSPLNLEWVNATVQLVQAFVSSGGQHAVFAGTCAEYDWTYGYCREETTPLYPKTLYGVAKNATRQLVEAICSQYQVRCAWGRLFFAYGEGESANRLIPALIDVLAGNSAPFGVNVNAFRDFLHISDVAAGILCLLHSEARGVYNISSGQPVRLGDMVKVLADLNGRDPEPILASDSERLGEPLLVVGENLRLKELGWVQRLGLEQGLEKAVLELRK